MLILVALCVKVSAGEKAFSERHLQKIVLSIEVSGNQDISEKYVFENVDLLTKINSYTDLVKVETDLKSIYALGYFDMVELQVEELYRGIKLIFVLKENPKIKKIDIQNNIIFSDKKILEKIKTQKGALLNFKKLKEDIKIIDSLYEKAHYDLSHVDAVNFDQVNHVLTIKILETKIEEIIITGNIWTNEDVIRREMRLRRKDVYNSNILRVDRNKIISLGYFSDVYAPKLVRGTSIDKIKVIIRVKEQKVNLLNFGTGSSASEEYFFFINLGFKNPFRTGEKIDIKTQYSRQNAKDKQTYSFQYQHPWMFRSPTVFTSRLWKTIGDEEYNNEDIQIVRHGLLGRFMYPFTDNLQLSLTGKTERIQTYDDLGPDMSKFDYYNNSLCLQLDYKKFEYDNFKYVVRGSIFNASMEQGGKSLGFIDMGGVKFERYKVNISHYLQLLSLYDILAMRLIAGAYKLDNSQIDTLESDLYSVGGSNTLRGIVENTSLVHKGTRMIVFNIEYRHAFNEFFQSVIFTDIADAFDAGKGLLDNCKFRISKGLGIRFRLSGLTIRFDYAWLESDGVLHFSLGQMF